MIYNSTLPNIAVALHSFGSRLRNVRIVAMLVVVVDHRIMMMA